jgi:hypothetical protein
MSEKPETTARRARINEYLLCGYSITEIATLEGIKPPNVCKYRDQILNSYHDDYALAKASHRYTKLAELARLKKKLNLALGNALEVDELKKLTDNLIKIIDSEVKLLGLDKVDSEQESELPVDLIMEVLELRTRRKKGLT